MIALSSLHFCPCDGRQAGLWYLPARWRYTTYVENLVEQTEALLRTHRIVLPGPAALARTVNAAHAHAEHGLFHR